MNLIKKPNLEEYMQEFKAPYNPKEQERKQQEANEKAAIIVQNKEDIKKAVEQNPEINKAQTKEIKKHLDKPEEVQKFAEKATGAAPSDESDSSLSSQFKQALTFFAPQLIGGALAGLAEGEEGLVAGFQAGGELRDSYIKFQRDNAEQEFRQQQAVVQAPKMDITPDFVVKGTNQPVFSRQDPKTGLPQFLTDQGKIIDSTKVESLKGVENRLREQGVKDRFDRRLDDKNIDRIDKSIKSFTTKADVKKLVEANDTMDPVINLLESDLPITADFLAPFIARGVQKEVGNLSETDLANARVPLDIANRIKSNVSGFFQGKMSPEERAATVRLLKFIKNKNDQQLSQKVSSYATESRSKRVQLKREDLEDQIRQEVGARPLMQAPQQITEQDIDNMSLEQLKAAGLLD